jgi:hypothetical protein
MRPVATRPTRLAASPGLWQPAARSRVPQRFCAHAEAALGVASASRATVHDLSGLFVHGAAEDLDRGVSIEHAGMG